MIHEYALDPATLKDWSTFKLLAEGFGISRARLIARYPKDWRRHAYATIVNLPDSTKKKLETWLADKAPKMMAESRKGSPYDRTRAWFQNALDEHRRKHFWAIISDQPRNSDPPVIPFTEIDADEPLWDVPRQVVVRRNAAEIGKHVQGLLVHARIVRFIDPYFSADPDQVHILLACTLCFREMGNCLGETVEIHVDGDKVRLPTVRHIQDQLRDKWPDSFPTLSVLRWQPGYLHNRFILMDRGGIMFGDSLRQDTERPDQITLLEDSAWERWWRYHDVIQQKDHLCP